MPPVKDLALDWAEDYVLTESLAKTKKYKWQCSTCGGSWSAQLNKRLQGSGCPYCANRKVLPGFNDLATKYPQIVENFWDYETNIVKPSEIMSHSKQELNFRCSSHHEWSESLSSLVRRNNCWYCSGTKLLSGSNDLATLYPKLLEEWDFEKNGEEPHCFLPTSAKKVHWVCAKGHSFLAIIRNRARLDTGCPYCSFTRFEPGLNDLASFCPELMLEWSSKNAIDPATVSPTSRKLILWECALCHFEWSDSPAYRRRIDRGDCPNCAKNVRSRHENMVVEFIRTLYSGSILQNRRPLKTAEGGRLEVDIWLPEIAIGFEIQDFLTHSRQSDNEKSWVNRALVTKKGPAYHALKKRLFLEQTGGILKDIWEDEIASQEFKKIIVNTLEIRC